jgi:hypothetical protein
MCTERKHTPFPKRGYFADKTPPKPGKIGHIPAKTVEHSAPLRKGA